MNKKLFTIIVLVFSFFLMPRVNAKITHLYLFDANFNTVVHTTSDCWTSNDAVDVRYGRFVFDDQLQANTPYTLNFQIGQTSYNKYVGFYWNGSSGINANGGYLKTSPTAAATLSQSVISGSPSIYQKSSSFTFDIKTSGASSNTFFQMDFGSYTLIRQFCLNSWSIAQGSSSSSDVDSQSIINNNNQNTQIIINNNNQNTENIINSQNETTDAIEDLNDTIHDTTIDDNALGGKLAEITSISDTPITDILTLPVNLLQKLYTSLSSSCVSYSLPFNIWNSNYTLNLPCINLGHEKYLGRVVWGVIDDLCCILMIFAIFKMVIWFYSSWTTLKDNFMYLVDPSNRGLF